MKTNLLDENKVRNIFLIMRKALFYSFKDTDSFKPDIKISAAFCGEGFYINHSIKVCDRIKVWGYDKHMAYNGLLLDKDFPLSSRLGENETKLGFYLCSFSGKFKNLKKRYREFYYTMYKNSCKYEEDENRTYILLTNLDYEIFKDMYVVELAIDEKYYFQDIGQLPERIKEAARKLYKMKKQDEDEYKSIYEATTYGRQAMYTDTTENWKATGHRICRDKYTPIAMFQAAYLRYEEWQQFVKYKDNIVYMNTDSIILDENLPHENSPELGKYGLEYDGRIAQFIRRMAYVVFNKDMTIDKKGVKISGCINPEDVTIEELDKLLEDKDYKMLLKTRNEEGQECKLSIRPLYLKYMVD